MSKPVPKSDMDSPDVSAGGRLARNSGPGLRKAFHYLATVISGGALMAIIVLLRLNVFTGWEKAVADLVMVATAVCFLVSVYMAVDATLKGPNQKT